MREYTRPTRISPAGFSGASPIWVSTFVLAALLAGEVFLFRDATFSNGWKAYGAYLFLPAHNWRFRGAAMAIIVASMVQVLVLLHLVQGLRKPVRAICLLCMWLAVSFEQGYSGAYGRFSTEEDLAMAWIGTAFQHWKTAIELYFEKRSLWSALLFVVLLLAPQKKGFRSTFLPAFTAVSVCFYALVWGLDDRLFSFRPFVTVSIAAFQRSVAALILSRTLTPPIPRDSLQTLDRAPPKTNVVLIVDESVAGDHLSLNGYDRPTTPFLDQLEQERRLVNLGLGVAGTTCSHSSGNLLMTGVRPQDLPARERLQRTPSLFQFARAAGYRTHFFDGQMTTFWLGTRVLWKGNFGDWQTVDDWRPASQFEASTRSGVDRRLAQAIRDTLEKTPQGAFIWAWKSGSHVPYTSCYSAAETRWTPTGDRLTDSAPLLNAYDNCISAAVDGFFEELLRPPHPWFGDTVFVYTSDHGQTLGRGGLQHTHCGTSSLEVVVPLFVVGEPGRLESVDVSWRDAAAHENIFATLLDFMGFPMAARPASYAPSLFRKRTAYPHRTFKDPDLDRGPATEFPESAIEPARTPNASSKR